jgi:hypothetical protein
MTNSVAVTSLRHWIGVILDWLKPSRLVNDVEEPDWRSLVSGVEAAHGYQRQWAWTTHDLDWWRFHIAEALRNLHEGHAECDAEVFALSAEVESYRSAMRWS